ncbi:MAG: cbb3-type cytochrome c oxidase N-terminal domain-containing protein [Planctomycetota bacterium]
MTQLENAGQGKYADELREHQFDGIEEFDNHLPNWWLWTFYGACIFSLFYWLYYHGLGLGPTSREYYEQEMAAAAAAKVSIEVTEESLLSLSTDTAGIQAGRQVFEQNCVACHGPDGSGTLGGAPLPGPNLTDSAWIHGSGPLQIHATITNGVVEKGMLAWGPILGPTKVQQVAAYVMTIRDTNVAGGKEPQGEVVGGSGGP